jgi:hypothetical protein
MADWRLVPEKISQWTRAGGFFRDLPVVNVKIYPPGRHPEGTPLRADLYAVEIHTPKGVSWQGFRDAKINSQLRVAVDITGREADEVIAKWKKARMP